MLLSGAYIPDKDYSQLPAPLKDRIQVNSPCAWCARCVSLKSHTGPVPGQQLFTFRDALGIVQRHSLLLRTNGNAGVPVWHCPSHSLHSQVPSESVMHDVIEREISPDFCATCFAKFHCWQRALHRRWSGRPCRESARLFQVGAAICFSHAGRGVLSSVPVAVSKDGRSRHVGSREASAAR
eukprot:1776041-Rhodomonas_salina.1